MPSLSYLAAVAYRVPAMSLATAMMGTANLLAAPFDAKGERQLQLARQWGGMLLSLAGAHVKTVGLEKIDRSRGYVITPNHVSYMDTPALLANIPLNFRFLAKEELFDWSGLGSHLTKAGHISVPLDDPRAALKVLTKAGQTIREKKLSLLWFPEGGRSETGELQPFKDGAAYLAIKGGVPILPVAIIGIRDVLPMHSHHVRPGQVTLRIGDPIETEGRAVSERGAVTQQVFETVQGMIAMGRA